MSESKYGTVERKCPFDGCSWSIEVGKMSENDRMAVEDAECRAEMHFDREHRGKARIKVVLECEVGVHPEQDLSEIVDRNHDSVEDDAPLGFDVAYAVGEYLEEPDGAENNTIRSDSGGQK